MANTREHPREGAASRPPVILLVTDPGGEMPWLEEALRRTGAVLICADPEAAPGFLEASEWPGMRVTVPDLVLLLGPASAAVAAVIQARACPPPIVCRPVAPDPDQRADLLSAVLAHIQPAHPVHTDRPEDR